MAVVLVPQSAAVMSAMHGVACVWRNGAACVQDSLQANCRWPPHFTHDGFCAASRVPILIVCPAGHFMPPGHVVVAASGQVQANGSAEDAQPR